MPNMDEIELLVLWADYQPTDKELIRYLKDLNHD